MGLYNDLYLEKKIKCFNIAHFCSLDYSFAPCEITSENWSRQKSVMLKQKHSGRRDANMVNSFCHGRGSQHRFPEGHSSPAVLSARQIPSVSPRPMFCAIVTRIDFASNRYLRVGFRPCLTRWNLTHRFCKIPE